VLRPGLPGGRLTVASQQANIARLVINFIRWESRISGVIILAGESKAPPGLNDGQRVGIRRYSGYGGFKLPASVVKGLNVAHFIRMARNVPDDIRLAAADIELEQIPVKFTCNLRA
jgi:hypothetical protein